MLRTSRVFRYRNPFAIVLQALEENGLLFTFAFSVLGVTTLLGGVTFYLVEGRVNPTIDTFTDGLWWALVTVTTVGFGDISAVSNPARLLTTVHMVAGLAFIGFAAKLVVAAAKAGKHVLVEKPIAHDTAQAAELAAVDRSQDEQPAAVRFSPRGKDVNEALAHLEGNKARYRIVLKM